MGYKLTVNSSTNLIFTVIEEKKLSEEKYQDTIVRCVAEGVENFLYKW